MVYQKYDDAAHGWLRVKVTELFDLNIHRDISNYSYLSPSGRYAYLEEDMDLTTFFRAYVKAHGSEPEIKYNCGLERSHIRNYPMYQYH